MTHCCTNPLEPCRLLSGRLPLRPPSVSASKPPRLTAAPFPRSGISRTRAVGGRRDAMRLDAQVFYRQGPSQGCHLKRTYDAARVGRRRDINLLAEGGSCDYNTRLHLTPTAQREKVHWGSFRRNFGHPDCGEDHLSSCLLQGAIKHHN